MTLSLLLSLALAASAQTVAPPGPSEVPDIGPAAEVPLHCRPEVIDAMKKAWDMVGRGREEYEAAFRIDRAPDGYSVTFATMTFETLRLTLDISPSLTVAIVHTHPDISVHHPADKDFNLRVPNYVVSSRGLTVTVPGTKHWKSVRRRWDRPCD